MTTVESSEHRDPTTPPPSLVSDRSKISNALSYTRDVLLSLATPKATPPARPRVESVSRLLRQDSVWQWGVEEEASLVPDGELVSKAIPIPKQAELIGTPDKGHPADVLFNFRSTPGDAAVPILIDFSNPEPFKPDVPTPSLSSSTTIIRFGPRISLSSSCEIDFPESISSRRVSSLSNSSLNPFAVPFRGSIGGSDDDHVKQSAPIKCLPASLPKKPDAPLPPVFVKRESATLPQPMALPDVAPLGKAWEGEASLSGNDRRRRASSAVGNASFSASSSSERPARLIALGQRLRQNSISRAAQ